jgi:hypothetical protein
MFLNARNSIRFNGSNKMKKNVRYLNTTLKLIWLPTLALILTVSLSYAAESIMQCQEAVFKMKQNFWSSPVAFKRIDGKWQNLRDICDLELEYSDMGVRCKQSGTFTKVTGGTEAKREILVDQNYADQAADSISRAWRTCKGPRLRLNHLDLAENFSFCMSREFMIDYDIFSPDSFLPENVRYSDFELTLEEFLMKFTPKVGAKETYRYQTPRQFTEVSGQEVHILDFLLLSWKVERPSQNLSDHSLVKSDTRTAKCEVL